MTLKQFFQLGGGALFAAIIYATSLHPFIKWPLILFSVSLGAAMAFLPFEERPLSHWIISFFTSVYSPTIFVWQSKGNYNFFAEETESVVKETPQGTGLPTKEEKTSANKLEESEKNFLANLAGIFNSIPNHIAPSFQKTQDGEKEIKIPQEKKPVEAPKITPPSISPQPFRPKIVVEQPQFQTQNQKADVVLQTVSPLFKEKQTETQTAQFSPQAAPPLPPTIPNTITGQVLDDKGRIVEGAILEIRDTAGRPVRALRSNKLGHFMIVTALPNGQYDIITEKDGYEFKPTIFEAKGEIIPPILITGRSLFTN